MSKKMKIALDADYLIFQCTESKFEKENKFDNEVVSLKPYKKRFKQLVRDVENEVAVDLLGKVKIKGIEVILSDSTTNFRYRIHPEYKGERSERSELFYRLRTWAEKKYGYVKDVEADDVVAYKVLHDGYLGASMDKDLNRGVEGLWFNVYHTKRTVDECTPKQARDFNLMQVLMGDRIDNIAGLPRVGEKTAMKLLDEFGWNWQGVVKAYESKGLSEKDAIFTLQLTSMRQLHKTKKGKYKIKLAKEIR